MATREEILKRFDHGDGANVGEHDCPAHGRTLALLIYNQCGYDCTIACLACATELHSACQADMG